MALETIAPYMAILWLAVRSYSQNLSLNVELTKEQESLVLALLKEKKFK